MEAATVDTAADRLSNMEIDSSIKRMMASFGRVESPQLKKQVNDTLRDFGITKEMLLGTVVAASLTLIMISSVLIVAVFAATAGNSESASQLTTAAVVLLSGISARSNDPS